MSLVSRLPKQDARMIYTTNHTIRPWRIALGAIGVILVIWLLSPRLRLTPVRAVSDLDIKNDVWRVAPS